MARWLVVVAGLFLASGCADQTKSDTRVLIPLTRLPAPVRSAAYFKVVGVRYHTAWVSNDGLYSLRGKDQEGKTTDIDFAADGTILRVR
jgi:hypothetical protein